MATLLVTQHPDKTIIGRIAPGFDFLGYRFTADGLAVARQKVERSVGRISRLYEHRAALGTVGAGGTRGNASGDRNGLVV